MCDLGLAHSPGTVALDAGGLHWVLLQVHGQPLEVTVTDQRVARQMTGGTR